MSATASEHHLFHRAGWLRAAVLGADDGIVSTASLVIGVAAAQASRGAVITAGLAGLVAGAMSMAAGEYVSVASQRDTEDADLRREAAELASNPDAELEELSAIYRGRGLDAELAGQVAVQLSAGDRLLVHSRDELGMSESGRARPLQAAAASAVAFAAGAALPLLALGIASTTMRIPAVAVVSLISLVALGAAGANIGGAPWTRASLRVLVGGAIAMLASAAVGALVGSAGG